MIDRLTIACYTLDRPDAGTHRARHSVAWRVCHFCDQFCAQCGNQYKRMTNDGQSVIFHVRDSSEEWHKMNNMNLDMEITKLGEEMTKCSKQCEGIVNKRGNRSGGITTTRGQQNASCHYP